MQLKIDADTFDQYQQILIRELIEQIRLRLVEAGLTGQQLKESTAHIAFSVASTIDDTSRIEMNGVEVKPCLTFITEDEQHIYSGENSYMHEYVAELINDVFNQSTPSD